MTKLKTLTGPELETLGLMKFTCDKCKEIFPVRCGEHRRIVVFEGNYRPEEEPEPDHRKLELLTRLERVVPERRRVLAFGRPIAGYDAPYEMLTAEIEGIPLGARD